MFSIFAIFFSNCPRVLISCSATRILCDNRWILSSMPVRSSSANSSIFLSAPIRLEEASVCSFRPPFRRSGARILVCFAPVRALAGFYQPAMSPFSASDSLLAPSRRSSEKKLPSPYSSMPFPVRNFWCSATDFRISSEYSVLLFPFFGNAECLLPFPGP